MSLKNLVDIILRWAIGAVFLFSGFVKSVDPIGSAIYVEKYLTTYSLDALLPIAQYLAILLAAVEMVLGVMLVLNVKRGSTLVFTTIILSLFTIVTLLGATLLPIGDCGCFGEALKLSPWATFAKNVVLLTASIYLLCSKMPTPKRGLVSIGVVLLVLSISVGVNLYSLCHLPLIDFMPYKVGTPLRECVVAERDAHSGDVELVFRDIKSGELSYFAQDDTACWTNTDLEYVDVRSVAPSDDDMLYADFAIYDECGEDVSLDLLSAGGRVAWLCIANGVDVSEHRQGINNLLMQYPSGAIKVLTSSSSLDDAELSSLDCYMVDAMTLRSIIRAEVGVVILNDGVVEFKSNIDDI